MITMEFHGDLSGWMRVIYVVFAFCSAFSLGALKGLLVGPIAGLILIVGNVGVILGLFPAHVAWTVYSLLKIHKFDRPLQAAILFALPALFGLWLALSMGGSILLGVGYGCFAPWVSTFEAFRNGNESNKFLHSLIDGTWGTIKGSCTVVRDFSDLCYFSYPSYLKELRESPPPSEHQTLRLIHVPACVIVGVLGLIVEIPCYTAIALVKSPYMLFRGWFRLIQDLISREGPFLETACIPIAGLTIILWPLFVVASILMSIFSGIFIGLYGSVVVFQERSFVRGVAYLIAMVAEFDEYTNDWLYLREGTILPKPLYRKGRTSHSSEFSGGSNTINAVVSNFHPSPMEPPAMLVPSLVHSVSVREAIQEVRMVQIWGSMMRSCELRGKELLDADVLKVDDFYEWLKGKSFSETSIISVGLPCYSLLQTLLHSIKANSNGLLLTDGVEINYLNRPKDRLLDWFFNPIMVLKEQIRVIQLGEEEVRFLEKVILFGSSTPRMETWENGSSVPQDALRAAQIQGISRRMIGMITSVSKFPTYKRKFQHIVKALVTYYIEREGYESSDPITSRVSEDNV